MKFSTFSIVLYATCSFCQALLPAAFVNDEWQNFKKSYNQKFVNATEEAIRKSIFSKQLEKVEEHNKKFKEGLVLYEIGINKFSDFTEEEIKPYTHGVIVPKNVSKNTRLAEDSRAQAPSSFDWRSRGVVTPVKNQGGCGSCWAFSTTGTLEARYKIRTGQTVSLSEQQLVDCDHDGAYGCRGGWMYEAFLYIANNKGINFENDYPYEHQDGSCRYNSNKAKITISNAGNLPQAANEEVLKNAVYNDGPVTAAIDAGGNFQSYKSGVYYNPNCSPTTSNHAVVIVGYGSENGQDYWWVKNSWGPDWGLNGYIKMARNRNNNCGIASINSYPIF